MNMNRIVLIGNGFDLAHGLPTSYQQFVRWYCDQRINAFVGNITDNKAFIRLTFAISRFEVVGVVGLRDELVGLWGCGVVSLNV